MKVISSEKLPIKLWLEDIEDGALEQAKNLANLPFAYKWISIMPDSHQGYGMPIGGVLATKGVVIPNAVGCFTGDTKIPLLNGMQKTLKELADKGDDVYVYSSDKNLKLVAGKATPKLTRKDAEIIEVFISGGDIIKCTPDHKFMLLDGSYKQAKDLKSMDSLMPLYRSYESKDGYEHIRTTSGTGVTTHKMVAKQFLGVKKDSDIVHHKDEKWFNNEPKNLEYKNVKLHSSEHRKNNPIFGTEEFKKKRLENLQKNGFYKPEFSEKKKQIARENLNKYNKSDKKKEQDKLAGKRGAKYLIKYNKEKNNHKVLFINTLSYVEDVYCLTVEKYHNFALSAGVFVHNCDIGCGMCAVKTSLTEIDTTTLKKIMGEIRKAVPVGFNKHKEKQDFRFMPKLENSENEDEAQDELFCQYRIVANEFKNALYSLGSLGGGNHFLEIQKGSDGHIWVMLHSGSRNLGKQIADHYNKLAIKLNEKWFSEVPKKWELAFLPIDSDEGQLYINEMQYAVDFALANRNLMMDRIKSIFTDTCPAITFSANGMINIAHNYARSENHCSTCIDNHGNDNRIVEYLLGDERVSKVQGSLVGYRPFVHSCGGLLLSKGASVLKFSPLQIDVLEQMIGVSRFLDQGLVLKHNHSAFFCPCEDVSFAQTDEAYYTSLNKFGLGFSHLFGVEKDYRKWDRILGRILLGYEAYNLDCLIKSNNTSIISQKHNIEQVWVHRKGATLATQNTIGIIPGSQGTKSYIVKGKGNPESFNSCSHGAGRKMSRNQAEKELNLEEEIKKLDDKGIVHAIRGKKDLDEASGAYKPIEVVMENQKDLVDILIELSPLGVIKG